MGHQRPSGCPQEREVSFLLIQAEAASRLGLIQALEPMIKILAAPAVALLLVACAEQLPTPSVAPRPQLALPVLSPGPFIGVDSSKLPPAQRKIIQEASEDFRAVVQGHKPIHAKFDNDADLPSDGGTTFYKGDSYDLTISLSLSSFGDFNATAYGPIITFNDTFAPGNSNVISDIRVYSDDELRKFLQ